MKPVCTATKYAVSVTVLLAYTGCSYRSDSSTAESSAPTPSGGNMSTLAQLAENSPHAAFAQITDGTSETLLAGTVAEGRSVPWTKPDDIRLDDTFLSKENSFVEGYFMFANGSIQYIHIEDDLDPAKFRALFTINGSDTFTNLYPPGHKVTFPSVENPQDHVRHAQARMQIGNSLKRIARAFHGYHDTHKHLPPATVYGPDGKPWHSWRVLILPMLGHRDLYLEYDPSVPWDDPKNASILKKMPRVYRHPLSDDAEESRTRYLVISGPGTDRKLMTMKVAGILLLLASVTLVAIGLIAPLALSFWTIASTESSPRLGTLGNSVAIPLVCLPASAIAAVTGLVLLIVSLRRK